MAKKSKDRTVGDMAAQASTPRGWEHLRSIVDRIERLEEERKALGSDIKDIYTEAKSAGYDVKVLRTLIRERKSEPAEIEEQESLLQVYKRALGMLVDTPLGRAAIDRVAASPGVQKAVKNLKDGLRKSGTTMTITTAGHDPVTIG